ncbi:RhoGEF domain containing protein, partial [Acanthamoeba castellanii str. Neff]
MSTNSPIGTIVRPPPRPSDEDDHKKRAAVIAQKLSESQSALYKVQTQIRELQSMYRKELDQCLSNIALTNVIRQADEAGLKKRTTEEAAAEALVEAEAESETTASEVSEAEADDDEEDGADDDDGADDEEFATATVNETELAMRFFNDRKELLERIVANLQEILDSKDLMTPSVERQPSFKRLADLKAIKDSEASASASGAAAGPSLRTPPQTPLPPLPAHAKARMSCGQPALVRVSELMESEAIQKNDSSPKPGGKDGVDEEEKERQRKRLLTPLERTREEFFETEESYVAGLAIIVKVYLVGVTGILSPNDLDTIFSNVATIFEIHKNLLQDISHIKDKERAQTGKSFGDSLKAFIPFLKMYTVYINAFDDANKRIGELMNTSKKFAAYLQEAQARPECKKLDLTSYLIMPVQRLPRYELLLRDLIRLTPPEDSEHPKLSSLLEAVVLVNKHVNESKKNAELRQKLQVSIKDKVDIFSRVNRHLIREGSFQSYELRLQDQGKETAAELARQNVEGVSLLNVSLKRLPFKERYFFLFDDYLLEVSLPTRSGKYKFIRKVDLRNMTAVSWEKDKERELKDLFPQRAPNANSETPTLSNEILMLSPAIMEDEDKLVLSVVDGTKRYLYKFKSTTERDDWHDVLNKQSAKCKAEPASAVPELEIADRGQSSLSNLLGFSPASMLTPREVKRPKKSKKKSKSKKLASSATSLVAGKKKRSADLLALDSGAAPDSPTMARTASAMADAAAAYVAEVDRRANPPTVARSTSSLAV